MGSGSQIAFAQEYVDVVADVNDVLDCYPPYLVIRSLCDPDHVERREVEVRVATADGWSGIALTGTAPVTLRDDARALESWAANPLNLEGEAIVELIGSSYDESRLRFFIANSAGHIACDAQLTRRVHRLVPGVGEERRLTVLLWTEPMEVKRFARLLTLLAEGSEETVVLSCLDRRL